MPSVRFSFTLNALLDSQTIQWLQMQPNQSAAIREALIAYQERPNHYFIVSKLDEILSVLHSARIIETETETILSNADEPERARQGLEAMKAKFRRGQT